MRPGIFLIILCASILAFSQTSVKAAAAFEWPQDALPTQKMQVLRQEIYNLKILLSSAQSQKQIGAVSYLAVDLSDDAILLQKNVDQSHSIASTTKLMSAVIATENIDSAKNITLTKKMLSPYGSSPCLFAGLKISAKNLLQASLIQSANDATESLAYFLGKEKFLGLMSQKAKELKMANTYFADVTGLNQKNRSTASDMVKLLTYIRQEHPEILATTRENNFWLPNSKGKLLKFMNLNNFYSLPEFVGGKTGYLPEAKEAFAALFNINGKPIAIVVLHSPNSQADTFKILNQIKKQLP